MKSICLLLMMDQVYARREETGLAVYDDLPPLNRFRLQIDEVFRTDQYITRI